MIDDRHNPNQELMAQGIANFVTPFFGGMPATGTIARTVTNIKSGATSPVAGMVHAATLLVVILVAAPLGVAHSAGVAGRDPDVRGLETWASGANSCTCAITACPTASPCWRYSS
jgi:hypothetical protein